jgi:hypothetical protein
MGRLRGQAQIPEQRCLVTEPRVADRLRAPQPDTVVPNLYLKCSRVNLDAVCQGEEQRQRVFKPPAGLLQRRPDDERAPDELFPFVPEAD